MSYVFKVAGHYQNWVKHKIKPLNQVKLVLITDTHGMIIRNKILDLLNKHAMPHTEFVKAMCEKVQWKQSNERLGNIQ